MNRPSVRTKARIGPHSLTSCNGATYARPRAAVGTVRWTAMRADRLTRDGRHLCYCWTFWRFGLGACQPSGYDVMSVFVLQEYSLAISVQIIRRHAE